MGLAMLWLSLIVLLPLAALAAKSLDGGLSAFWDSVSSRQAVSALKFTLIVSVIVAAINAVAGVAIAWTLVRDAFPGRRIVNAIIDLPFAMPTIVVGITLLALWGPSSPVGVNLAFTQLSVALALLFVTLPFGVRAVQPVLIELDVEMEQAAASLGAGPLTTKQIESDNASGAAAVAVVLLGVSLLMLIGLRFIEYWGSRHDH
jgi:sulfate transport system permease protein